MQNKEFDKLVESFLSPKTKLEDNNAFSLASLLSLVEEVERVDVINEAFGTPIIFTSTEKKYESEPEEATKFFQIFQKVLAKDVLTGITEQRLQQLISKINLLKNNPQANTAKSLSETFAIILFVGSLNNMIGNLVPDLPSVAGTFFEKFIAFMSGGKAMGAENKIYDIEKDMEYVSLKLVREFTYRGSINEMGDFFLGEKNIILQKGAKIPKQNQNKRLTAIIAIKESIESGIINFHSYNFGYEEFLTLLGEEQLQRYNEPFKIQMELDQKLKYISNLRDGIDAYNRDILSLEQIDDPSNLKAIEDLQKAITDLQQEIKNSSESIKVLQDKKTNLEKKRFTQFNIDKTMMDQLPKAQRIMTGSKKDILSLSTKDKNDIIKGNTTIFNDSIKTIIEQSNIVYYRVNNFLLSDEKQRKTSAVEAYESVSKLEEKLREQIE